MDYGGSNECYVMYLPAWSHCFLFSASLKIFWRCRKFCVFWRFLALWNRCCNLPTLQSMASISAMLHSWWLGGRTLGPLNFSALVVGEGKALHLGVSQVSTLEQLIFDSESTLLEKAGTACKSGELVTTVSKHLKFTVWNEEKVRI